MPERGVPLETAEPLEPLESRDPRLGDAGPGCIGCLQWESCVCPESLGGRAKPKA